MNRGDHFRFASVFIKKITKPNLKKKLKPNRNRFKPTGFGLVFLDKNRFKLVGLVWLGFFLFDLGFFGLGSVRFFQFQAYKTETEPNRSVF
jgi:hypothetical protein